MNKLPTLAVKILLHMRKYKIEVDSITNSYYNKALIEGEWPSFERDRWGKLRSIVNVIKCFKYTLELKKQRDDEAAKSLKLKNKNQAKEILKKNTSFSSQSHNSLQDSDKQSRSNIAMTNESSQIAFSLSNSSDLYLNAQKSSGIVLIHF